MDQETGKTFFTGNAAQMYQFFVQATGLGACVLAVVPVCARARACVRRDGWSSCVAVAGSCGMHACMHACARC